MSNYLSEEKKEELAKLAKYAALHGDTWMSVTGSNHNQYKDNIDPATITSLIEENAELKALIKQADIDEDFLLKERDNAEEWADKLAAAIDPGEEIGEHTNLNNPWANALEMITDKLEALTAAEAERDKLQGLVEHTVTCMMRHCPICNELLKKIEQKREAALKNGAGEI